MKTHELKTWPQPFEGILFGEKRHEVRKADRDYRRGDRVRLREWVPPRQQTDEGHYTGREVHARIGYVTRGGEWGIPDGLCVFSLLDVEVKA